MTVWYAGTLADYASNAANDIVPNGSLSVWVDAARTTLATDLVNEAGDAIGGRITARPSGFFKFGRPDGNAGPVYISDGGTGSIALFPANGIGGDTDSVPLLAVGPTKRTRRIVTEDRFITGTVNAADIRFGQWPLTDSGDITANLDAAMRYAWGIPALTTRYRVVTVPGGSWQYSGFGYNDFAQSVALRGSRINTTVITFTGKNPDGSARAPIVLINPDPTPFDHGTPGAPNVRREQTQHIEISDLTISGFWGLLRVSVREFAANPSVGYRTERVVSLDTCGSFLSHAGLGGYDWRIDCRVVGRPDAPTIGVALAGVMDASVIRVAGNKLRIPVKADISGHTAEWIISNIYHSGHTLWESQGWLIPEYAVRNDDTGQNSIHPGGWFRHNKIGTENYVANLDYRYISADPQGTFIAAAGIGGIQVSVAPRRAFPAADGTPDGSQFPVGWSAQTIAGTGGNAGKFQVVLSQNGTVMETSPWFTTFVDAAAWGTGLGDGVTASKWALIVDLALGGNTASGPVIDTLPIGDFSTAFPQLDRRSKGAVWGVGFTDANVTNGGSGPTRSLVVSTCDPDNVRGVRFRDTYSSSPPLTNCQPRYLWEFTQDLTPPADGIPKNFATGTVAPLDVRTTASAASVPNPKAPQIAMCNVPGVFRNLDSPVHRGTPTAVLLKAAGYQAANLTVTGTDDAAVVSWRSGGVIRNVATTNGSPGVNDAAATADMQGHTVSGAGIPSNTFVGTVTAGTGFRLSSSATAQVDVNATATGSAVSATIGAPTVGPQVTVTWNQPFGAAPLVAVTPCSNFIGGASPYPANITATAVDVGVGSAAAGAAVLRNYSALVRVLN